MERRRAWPLWTAAFVAVAAIGTTVGDQPAIVEAHAGVITPSPIPSASPSPTPSPAPSPSPSQSPSPAAAPSPSPEPPARTSSGRYLVAPGENQLGTGGRVFRYTVEVEEDLDIDVVDFADAVDTILGDPRSWTGTGSLQLERVDSGPVRFRVTLASPATVDRACLPLRTGSWLSCWNGSRVMLNVDRWTDGAETYGDDVAGYRRYLVNHEVGHALGHDHVGCPGKGEIAPVMLQQTKSLFGCVANPWPYPDTEPGAPEPSPGTAPTDAEQAVVTDPVASPGRYGQTSSSGRQADLAGSSSSGRQADLAGSSSSGRQADLAQRTEAP